MSIVSDLQNMQPISTLFSKPNSIVLFLEYLGYSGEFVNTDFTEGLPALEPTGDTISLATGAEVGFGPSKLSCTEVHIGLGWALLIDRECKYYLLLLQPRRLWGRFLFFRTKASVRRLCEKIIPIKICGSEIMWRALNGDEEEAERLKLLYFNFTPSDEPDTVLLNGVPFCYRDLSGGPEFYDKLIEIYGVDKLLPQFASAGKGET